MQFVRSSRKKSKPPCPIQKTCRICPYVNQDYQVSLNIKAAKELQTLKQAGLLNGVTLHRIVPSPRKVGYRTVFKLAVRRNPDKKIGKRFRLGLFDPGTHRIGPDLAACPLHHSYLRKVLKALHPILEESSLEPYDEETCSGDLRYLVGRTNMAGDQLMMTWVVSRPVAQEIQKMTQQLLKQDLNLHVSAMNINPGSGNAILGQETVYLGKNRSIEEDLLNLKFHLGPTSFFQVNPWQAEKIYLRLNQMVENLLVKESAWDLFSGVGPISCVLGRHFSRTMSLEENEEAIELAKKNAALNRLEQKIQVLSGLVEKELEDFPQEFQGPDLIVVNPSRRGIHQRARKLIAEALHKKSHAQLIYLSCDVESFKRDLLDFQSQGLVLREIQGFDMHAQSPKCEWLSRLSLAPSLSKG